MLENDICNNSTHPFRGTTIIIVFTLEGNSFSALIRGVMYDRRDCLSCNIHYLYLPGDQISFPQRAWCKQYRNLDFKGKDQ